ncbi:MAG: rhodanese-like domain-containing protein [Woeseiaceae bacterium]|nr:rhodanese-like domain-containing protein [Woeseiaceae bacterium]
MGTYLEFIGNHLVLVTALMASFFLLVFTELKRKAMGITNLDPQEAVKLINADAAVIDLRPAEAYARGHIVGARNIPHDELDDSLEKLKRFKSKPIVAVCDAGMTSAKVVTRLRREGIDNVYGIKGGINAWTEASLPLVSTRKTKAKKK